MMPTFPPSRAAQGFTLMEMLVVLTIVGILAAVMANYIQDRRPFRDGESAVRKFQIAVRETKSAARKTGAPASLYPAKVMEIVSSPSEIIFYPDGSSSGGVIMLADHSALKVDWLTGEVFK